MSAMADRVNRLSMSVRAKLPALLVPQSDEKLAEHQRRECSRLAEDLRLCIRELKNHENLVRIQNRKKSADPWALKQRLADLRLERARAEELAQQIERALRDKGLNPMEAASKIHELIENSEIHLDEAAQAIAAGRGLHFSIGPATNSMASHLAPLQVLDTAVPVLTFAYLLLKWAGTKLSSGQAQRGGRAS